MRPPFLAAIVALAVFAPRSAHACALLSSEDTTVQVDGEEVLIVWDAEASREHLIRHIGFQGDAEDFGFLVPTPSEPEVAEVTGTPFETLFRLYHRPAPRARSTLRSRGGGGGIGLGSMDDVEVVAQHHVAGQTATVLRANDSAALDRWLADNGYPSGEALRNYLESYVARGWYVTAFKYDAGAPRVDSPTIRLSFDAEAPFFPYAEPRGRRPARPFRLSVVATTPMRAHRSRTGPRGPRWSARIGYRHELRENDRAAIVDGAGVRFESASALHVTTWDEPRSRRGRDDLYFAAQPNARPVRPRITTRIVPAPQRRRGIGGLQSPFGGPTEPRVRGRVELREVRRDGGAGTFDESIVNRMFRARLRALQRCYERELRTNRTLTGDVTVHFEIAEQGIVRDARVETNTIASPAVGNCARQMIRRFRFNPGAVGGPAGFAVQLHFEPQR